MKYLYIYNIYFINVYIYIVIIYFKNYILQPNNIMQNLDNFLLYKIK